MSQVSERTGFSSGVLPGVEASQAGDSESSLIRCFYCSVSGLMLVTGVVEGTRPWPQGADSTGRGGLERLCPVENGHIFRLEQGKGSQGKGSRP